MLICCALWIHRSALWVGKKPLISRFNDPEPLNSCDGTLYSWIQSNQNVNTEYNLPHALRNFDKSLSKLVACIFLCVFHWTDQLCIHTHTHTHTLEHKDTHKHFIPLNKMILVLMETEDTFYSINHRDHTTRHTKWSFHNTATSPLCLSFFIALSPLFLTLSCLKCRVIFFFFLVELYLIKTGWL